MKVYLAGPYSSETAEGVERNVSRAISAGILVLLKGHYPFIPHLTHYVDLVSTQRGLGLKWEDYIDWDLAWLQGCDAILHIGSSKGADLELEVAQRLGKKVFRSIDEIPSTGHRHRNLEALVSHGLAAD